MLVIWIFLLIAILLLRIIQIIKELSIELVILIEFFLCGESTGFDLTIKINFLINVIFQNWHTLESKPKSLGEEPLDALDISLEVVLGIRMGGGSHLREINYCDILLLTDH